MSQTLSVGSIFLNNRTQAVRLPSQTRFPAYVSQVQVRVQGIERILSPIGQTWDSFFLSADDVPSDFARGEQLESVREAFE
jgi:antitoxin VapB